MKLRLGIAFAILVTAGLLGHGAADPVTRVILPDTSGVAGQRLRLPIDIENVDHMQAARIDIVFDSTVVKPRQTSLQIGEFGHQIQASWLANQVRDTLRVGFFTADTTGYVGSGTLVTIEWDLVGAGTSALHLYRIELERMPDIVLPATGDDGSVAVDPAAVEEGTWGRVKQRFGGGRPRSE